jgi:hypothetical protein
VISYYCKYTFRVLNRSPSSTSSRSRERLYDEAALQALTVLWKASDRICGKQKAIIPVLGWAMSRGTPSALGCGLGDQTKRAGTHFADWTKRRLAEHFAILEPVALLKSIRETQQQLTAI